MKTQYRQNIITLTIGLLCSLWLNSALGSEEELKSIALIKKILPKECIFSGDFLQKRKMQNIPKPLESSGNLFFSCDKGILWQNKLPYRESLIYTPSQLHYRYLDQNEIIPLEGLQHHYLANFLLSLLSADITQIQKQFSIQATSNLDSDFLKLSPKSEFAKKGIDSITLEKNTVAKTEPYTKTRQDEKLIINIFDKKNQNTRILITNFTSYTQEAKKHDYCIEALNSPNECQVLASPYDYQVTENN